MLNATQLAAVKADILANPDLNNNNNNDDGNFEVARLYNLPASPDFLAWNPATPVQDIFNAINWSLYTPSGAVDDTALALPLTAAQRQAQLLAIQTKQINLQTLLSVRSGSLDMGKALIRSGLRDAVIQIPAGASGANVAPGGASGATVLAVCVRKANRIEKLLVTSGADTTGNTTAAILGFVGTISPQDVTAARNS